MRLFPTAGLALLLVWVGAARAQIAVEVVLDQDQYLRDESLPVRVRITNQSGQSLLLGVDDEWLSLAVESLEEPSAGAVARLADPSIRGEFKLDSAHVATRQVDITPCFEISQPARYQVTATLKIKEWGREFSSKPRAFEVVRGTKLWEQEFGVQSAKDAAPETRKYMLQQANYRKQMRLYLRLTDLTEAKVFRVFALGPMVSFSQPEAQLDRNAYLHLLYQSGPRSFLFEVVNSDGDLVLRQTYDYTSTRPVLKSNEGRIFVSGGARRITAGDLPPPLASNNGAIPDSVGAGGLTNQPGKSQPPAKEGKESKK